MPSHTNLSQRNISSLPHLPHPQKKKKLYKSLINKFTYCRSLLSSLQINSLRSFIVFNKTNPRLLKRKKTSQKSRVHSSVPLIKPQGHLNLKNLPFFSYPFTQKPHRFDTKRVVSVGVKRAGFSDTQGLKSPHANLFKHLRLCD